MKSSRISRRRFLGHGAIAASAAVAAPLVVRSSVLGYDGATAPNDRVTIGLIGCGSHGCGWNLDRMFENPDSQVIAVCDVDSTHLGNAEQKVNGHYSKTLGGDYKACDTYSDFRDVINRKDIDAVDVVTPDHWHVIPALMAVKAGKDVICEKPLTLTVQEGRILSDAAKANNTVFQTASENRSIDSYIRICELVRNGAIGELRHMKVLLPPGNRHRHVGDVTIQDPPETLDWEMWQGQAKTMPYCSARCHYDFRWNLLYSGGVLTDWGAHMIDLAQWASGHQETGPVTVEGTCEFPPKDAVWNAPAEFDLHYKYKNGMTMNVFTDTPGIKFEGTEGWVMFRGWRAENRASDPKILDFELGEDADRLHRPRVVVSRAGGGGGEHRNFIDCVKSREQCYAPAEIGHRTISIAHIGNIAMNLGRKLQWNPDTEQFVGNDVDAANAQLSREQREPWSMKNVDSWINVG